MLPALQPNGSPASAFSLLTAFVKAAGDFGGVMAGEGDTAALCRGIQECRSHVQRQTIKPLAMNKLLQLRVRERRCLQPGHAPGARAVPGGCGLGWEKLRLAL